MICNDCCENVRLICAGPLVFLMTVILMASLVRIQAGSVFCNAAIMTFFLAVPSLEAS